MFAGLGQGFHYRPSRLLHVIVVAIVCYLPFRYVIHSWFDLYDWPIGVGSQDDAEGLLKGVAQIEQEIAKLKAEGIPASKIVVGGFSQGGAVALLAAYQNKSGEPYAGCVSLSGWLTLVSQLESIASNEVATQTPLYWGHGVFDDSVLFAQQKFGVDRLKAVGVTDIQAESFDMGHETRRAEMLAMAGFVDKLIFGGGGDGTDDKDL
jgi:predicted esterase